MLMAVNAVENSSNIKQAMEAWGVSWMNNSMRVSKKLTVSGEIGGEIRLTNGRRDVVFVYDSNNMKLECDDLADQGLPPHHGAQWQQFSFDKKSKTLTISGSIHGRTYEITIEP